MERHQNANVCLCHAVLFIKYLYIIPILFPGEEPQICPVLNNPKNGKVKFTEAGRRVGAEVWYSCDAGFRLVGVESRRCQPNLEWSSEAPTCQGVKN